MNHNSTGSSINQKPFIYYDMSHTHTHTHTQLGNNVANAKNDTIPIN